MTADGTRAPPDHAAADQLNPEEHLMALEDEAENKDRDTIATMMGLFDKDEECQLVLMGWMDGLRGKALREAVGVDQARIDYLIKKIRRVMEKRYPNGWRQ